MQITDTGTAVFHGDYGQAADPAADADHAAYEQFVIAEAGTITEGSVMRVRNHRGFGHGLRDGEDWDMNCPSCTAERKAALDAARAQYDAVEDHAASCERTVAAGRCTGCEQEASELVPWTPQERLCWLCADLQLDLLALAMGEAWAVTS